MTSKRIISFLLASLMLVLCSCANTPPDQPMGGWDTDPDLPGDSQSHLLLSELSLSEEKGMEASSELSEAISRSAFNYFGAAIEEGKAKENILISPLSIYIALAMTACGAEGETLSQMQSVLGDVSIEEAAHCLYALGEELTAGEKIKLGLANSVWIRDNEDMIKVNPDFVQVMNEYFSADVFMAQFDDGTLRDINNWIEGKTDGMIKEMLDEIPAEAVMYLINALVFEADWKDTYERTQLRDSKFTLYSGERIDAELMYGSEDYYLEDYNAKGFIKPYADSRYVFVALLPDEGTDVYNYAASLTGERFSELLDSKRRAIVDTAMPQFSYEYDDSLVNELMSQGMTDAFNGTDADLTGLGTSSMGNLYISDVLHKTFIEVSPKGTKAGAATVVEVKCESAVEIIDAERYQVYLDRPFVYAITDLETGTPIFLGILANPE